MGDRKGTCQLPIEYFDWLSDIVNLRSHNEYSKLLLYLFETEFTWVVRNDINRAKDGQDLRYDFLNKSVNSFIEIGDSWLDEPCSVLEMFIALARRIRFDIMPEFSETVEDWFWIFMDNLELLKYYDRHYYEVEVDKIIQKFMRREYSESGKFCVFFSKKTTQKQLKTTELWYQMHFWLDENYDF